VGDHQATGNDNGVNDIHGDCEGFHDVSPGLKVGLDSFARFSGSRVPHSPTFGATSISDAAKTLFFPDTEFSIDQVHPNRDGLRKSEDGQARADV
jgi:hypothetical protein